MNGEQWREEQKTPDGKRRYTIKYLIIIEKFMEEKRNNRKSWAERSRAREKKGEKSGRMEKNIRENENRKNYLYFIYFMRIPQCSYVKMCRKCVLTPNRKIGNKRWIPETSFILSKTNEHNEFEIIQIKHTNTHSHEPSACIAKAPERNVKTNLKVRAVCARCCH